ncbi:MAG: DNA-formamidopyrimidine glycosylase [Candidatus Cloacimonadia bacterium]|jgi:formamidopyrimidine-DNA glycosylase
MPELPEVETIVRDLQACVIGKEIKDIIELRQGTVKYPADFTANSYGVIEEIRRRGKYIIIQLSSEYLLIVHLRMTGKLIYDDIKREDPKHLRCVIKFGDDGRLMFDDVRTFGTMEFIPAGDEDTYFKRIGIDALSEQITLEKFKELLSKKRTNIKNFLLDQSVIAGLGNIYANEILYRSKVSPLRQTAKITASEAKRIFKEMQLVLQEAIECNGTSISDYRRVDDKQGTFQNFLRVYGKESCPQGHEIERLKIGGRSTFYCKTCQK